MLPTLSGEFTVVADPDLSFTQDGKAVARVRLVANSRKKQGDEWVDDKTLWMRGTAFGKIAENIVESVTQGTRVVVTGRLVTDEWKDKDSDQKRQATALLIDKFGLDLMFDPARPVKGERKAEPSKAQPDNPWGGDTASSDEPPF